MQTLVQVVHKHDPLLELDENKLRWLTDGELTRYRAITSARRKGQFLAGHFLARKMASRLHGNAVEDWIYSVDENNQRRLKCLHDGIPELYVSLSHAGDWIAAAISNSAVGIDIETYGKQRDFIAIASHVFSKSETDILKSLAPEQLGQQFYLYWTMKECVAKQYGAGLKFEVSRAHSFIPSADPYAASINTWQCPEYVIAMAGNPNGIIEILGLGDSVAQLYWQNAPA